MTTATTVDVDVLCVGHACYDLVFSVSTHPAADEKIVANDFMSCGGGPATNAAVAISQLGFKAAFSGYLGDDLYGNKHYQELLDYGVNTDFVVRGESPTPLSTVLVKPNGDRALINYKGNTKALPAATVDFSKLNTKVMLFDGHEPYLSMMLATQARAAGIPTVLDAGSVHDGTMALIGSVDYMVCSEKFAQQFTGDVEKTLARLSRVAPCVVITLGESGLVWQRDKRRGESPAFPVAAIDTTGAGDAFHGAFAAAVAADMEWLDVLRYASAAGALCCTKIGARTGLPTLQEHQALFAYSS
jgi:sulfofructose kinase